ncbi:MAG: hypothetical protein ABSA63_07290 [Thermoplasmata archaeon]
MAVIGMAGGATISRTEIPRFYSRPSSLARFAGADLMVSLREIKAMAENLGPSHPLRILVLGEPDDIPRHEYANKVVGWFRLIVTPADSGPPGGH